MPFYTVNCIPVFPLCSKICKVFFVQWILGIGRITFSLVLLESRDCRAT